MCHLGNNLNKHQFYMEISDLPKPSDPTYPAFSPFLAPRQTHFLLKKKKGLRFISSKKFTLSESCIEYGPACVYVRIREREYSCFPPDGFLMVKSYNLDCFCDCVCGCLVAEDLNSKSFHLCWLLPMQIKFSQRELLLWVIHCGFWTKKCE